ncbi:hypothetical protein L7F22_007344 [Adiantum nelumboides]|nr:hypothetical protein [Adiantum nelumboides]
MSEDEWMKDLHLHALPLQSPMHNWQGSKQPLHLFESSKNHHQWPSYLIPDAGTAAYTACMQDSSQTDAAARHTNVPSTMQTTHAALFTNSLHNDYTSKTNALGAVSYKPPEEVQYCSIQGIPYQYMQDIIHHEAAKHPENMPAMHFPAHTEQHRDASIPAAAMGGSRWGAASREQVQDVQAVGPPLHYENISANTEGHYVPSGSIISMHHPMLVRNGGTMHMQSIPQHLAKDINANAATFYMLEGGSNTTKHAHCMTSSTASSSNLYHYEGHSGIVERPSLKPLGEPVQLPMQAMWMNTAEHEQGMQMQKVNDGRGHINLNTSQEDERKQVDAPELLTQQGYNYSCLVPFSNAEKNRERMHALIREDLEMPSTYMPAITNPSTELMLKKENAAMASGKAVGSHSGKDRHSKVKTSKGMRDRRVRLSVSTALQFYDIQDRLGFQQPSHVFEWLMQKAKYGIDELPPSSIQNSSNAKIHDAVVDPPGCPNSTDDTQHMVLSG